MINSYKRDTPLGLQRRQTNDARIKEKHMRHPYKKYVGSIVTTLVDEDD